jgi:lipopolysaccharide export system protein LptA
MKGRILFLTIVGLCLLFPHPDSLRAAEAKKKNLPDSQPIEITADRLEASDENKLVLFSGNAVAVQGDRVIKAEKIFLYYKKEGKKSGKDGLKNIGIAGDLEKIEARGQVSVSQGDRIVTGEQAIYYQDAQKIVMTGNAVMRQGSSIVRGDKIEVFLDENRGVVEAAETKRVKATIYPTDKEGGSVEK